MYSHSAPHHSKRLHLTEKPVPLLRKLTKIVSRGGVILDPFCGSGSTGTAALLEGHRFIGIELSHHYAEQAATRLATTPARPNPSRSVPRGRPESGRAMSGARLTTARLRQLAAELPDRYTEPVLHLSRARALSGGQLDRLLRRPGTTPRTAERARQRAMTHLCQLGLVATLERRIGGVRAGSAGYVHVLTPAGHKLAALLTEQQPPRRIRHSRAPGAMFIAHALDIAELYVQLTEHSHAGGFRVAGFVTEPATWWPIGNGGHLRPDAYTALAVPTHRDVWWLEVDRDTESFPRLRDKFRDYLDHATYSGSGPDGALPRVLFTTPSQERADAIHAAIANMADPDVAMFTVTTHRQAAGLLVAELHTQPEIRP